MKGLLGGAFTVFLVGEFVLTPIVLVLLGLALVAGGLDWLAADPLRREWAIFGFMVTQWGPIVCATAATILKRRVRLLWIIAVINFVLLPSGILSGWFLGYTCDTYGGDACAAVASSTVPGWIALVFGLPLG